MAYRARAVCQRPRYRDIIAYLGNDDPTTRRMIESILASEEEHAEDLSTLLMELGRKGEPAKEPIRKVV